MSDTIKLSELLEQAASLLSLESENFRECGADDFARQNADEAKALRAIAPALVELVAAKDAVRGADRLSLPDRINRVTRAFENLFRTMKEAGVTCE